MSLSPPKLPRWSAEKANAWWQARNWVCGFNYLPASAVNFLEMWMGQTFDREGIERELGWAADIGFNALRTNPHFLIWKHDRDGLIDRIDWFLDAAAARGLDVVLVPFDDCGFGGAEPVYGPQPDPVPGIHNGRAVASPGRSAVMDRTAWPSFEAYLRDLVATFRDDPRVLFWDIYNEPANGMIFQADDYVEFDPALADASRDLMCAAFDWAREEAPEQPVTIGAWRIPPPGSDQPAYDNDIDRLALEHSDIITFHAYCDRARAEKYIDSLSRQGRPMLSTEWMARAVDSRIADQLALYHTRKVGCFQWGLVQGRTQTWLPWPETLVNAHGNAAEPDVAFHDLLRPDGTPFDERETDLIRRLTSLRESSR